MYYAQTNLCFVDLQILFTKSSVQGNANSMNFFFFFFLVFVVCLKKTKIVLIQRVLKDSRITRMRPHFSFLPNISVHIVLYTNLLLNSLKEKMDFFKGQHISN